MKKNFSPANLFIALIILVLLNSFLGCALFTGRGKGSEIRYYMGLPYAKKDQINTREIGSVKNSEQEEYNLSETTKILKYAIGDGNFSKLVWKKVYLTKNNGESSTVKAWTFKEPVLGKILLSEDKNNVIVGFEGCKLTEIFKIEKGGRRIQKIEDFRTAINDKDAAIRKYAGRGLALNLLPQLQDIYPREKEYKIKKYKSELGELAIPLTLELLNDDFELSEEADYDPRAAYPGYPYRTNITERATAILPALNAKPGDTIIPVLEAWSRDKNVKMISGNFRDANSTIHNGWDNVYVDTIQKYGEEAVPYLLQALRCDNPLVTDAALSALKRVELMSRGKILEPLPKLIEIFQNQKNDISSRILALKVISVINSKEKIDILKTALLDKNWQIAQTAISTLQDDRLTVSLMIMLLKEKSPYDLEIRQARNELDPFAYYNKKNIQLNGNKTNSNKITYLLAKIDTLKREEEEKMLTDKSILELLERMIYARIIDNQDEIMELLSVLREADAFKNDAIFFERIVIFEKRLPMLEAMPNEITARNKKNKAKGLDLRTSKTVARELAKEVFDCYLKRGIYARTTGSRDNKERANAGDSGQKDCGSDRK